MASAEFGAFAFLLLLLIATAHLLGHFFSQIRQPRVIGEILAGVVLGPSVLGHVAPQLSQAIFVGGTDPALAMKYQAVVGFLYQLGLLLLMFASGAEIRGLFRREDRREVAWLASVGTALPFVIAVLVAPMLPLHVLVGPANHRVSLILVIGIAVAVTSIPLIAKIFHDLQILHTRFARLILSVAVLEDILLWAVLAVATALAASGPLPAGGIVTHVATTALYFALGMLVVPPLLRSVSRASSNVLVRNAPVAYVVMMLFAYTAAAAALDVNLVFAAFLAGYAVGACGELTEASASLNKVSFAVFIPVYFAVVGYQLDLTKTFSPALLTAVLVGACAIKLVSAGVGASLAGFNWRDSVNLSVALNARGGPGIVLASVAYEARIINGDFYTSLVILAVLTSQAAGAWLDHVLKRGWPLLTEPSRSAFSVEPRLKGESSAV